MPRIAASGKCELCGKSYRKSGMTRHLQSCLAKTGPCGEPRSRHGNSVHLLVEDTERPEYWMHLMAPERCTLQELDQYLRDIWLECCLHLSSFTIGGTGYFCPDYFAAMEDDGENAFLSNLLTLTSLFEDEDKRAMDSTLAQVVRAGAKFRHEYDFGSTTELTLRCLAELDGGADEIRLLARNDPPVIACLLCGASATWVSPADDDWIAMTAGLCDNCAPAADYRLPVVNSPRCGVCAYDGIPMRIVDDDYPD